MRNAARPAGEPSLDAALHGVPLVALQPLSAAASALAFFTSRGRHRCAVNQLLGEAAVPEFEVRSTASSLAGPVDSLLSYLEGGDARSAARSALQRALPLLVAHAEAPQADSGDAGYAARLQQQLPSLPADVAARAIVSVVQEYRRLNQAGL